MENETTTKPIIVCLCGSTRFHDEFQSANFIETYNGKIVLSVGVFGNSLHEKFMISEEKKLELDKLHKHKIDIADEILVLNVGGYIGNSTSSEIDYAKSKNKKIRFWEDHKNE